MGRTLFVAVNLYGDKCLTILLKQGAFAMMQNADQEFPLHEAVRNGSTGIVWLLLKARADANQYNM